jgi:hypothetical protein
MIFKGGGVQGWIVSILSEKMKEAEAKTILDAELSFLC